MGPPSVISLVLHRLACSLMVEMDVITGQLCLPDTSSVTEKHSKAGVSTAWRVRTRSALPLVSCETPGEESHHLPFCLVSYLRMRALTASYHLTGS